MVTPLLATKLHAPPRRPNIVSRARLVGRLDEGVRLGRRLTLVSAQAGCGKTTLVTEWISSSERPVAWLSLDEGDNDPTQFLHYLIAALQQVAPGIGQTIESILQSPQLPSLQGLVTLLINDITASAQALTLILDDYHLISSDSVHQVAQYLLDHQPPSMHVVIVTREALPLAVPRLRVRGQITEIREHELRFTTEEAAAFLNQTMGLHLSIDAVAALEARTEGWIAALQLAALALQEGQEDTLTFIATFSGDDRYVMDYLIAEVFQRQPEVLRAFLQQTAILDRLTAPLCQALTGREGSQAILEQLERANLFLIPLDNRREWYRYHFLFARFLRTTLDQEEQKHLHQQALGWYEANGYLNQAIQHALAYASVSDQFDDAERLIGLAADETIHHGGILTVRAWLDALPDKRVRSNGELATYKGWVLALSGEMERAEDCARIAEESLRRAGAPAGSLGRLLVLKAFVTVLGHRDYEATITLADSALQALGDDYPHWTILALWALAESQEQTRPISESIATLRKAQQTGRELGQRLFAIMVEVFLSTAIRAHGQRREAVAICEEAIARYTDDEGRLSPLAGLVSSHLGILYYEANELELARHHLDMGLSYSQQIGLEIYSSVALGFSAPTLYAQGETQKALQALGKAYELAVQTGLADPDWCLASEANIHLKEGDLASAIRWAEASGLSPDDEPQYLRIESLLVYGRILLAQTRLADTRRWLARLECFTRERGLYRWLLTVHILQALVSQRSGQHSVARDHLSQALKIAAPEDFFRAFLDEDEQLMALLPEVRHVAPSFVDRLLSYAGIANFQSTAAVQSCPVEPLSDREMQVLRLMAAGLSGPEIAEHLVVAVSTARSHIKSIYGKLGAHSRHEAIERARTLRLLDRPAR